MDQSHSNLGHVMIVTFAPALGTIFRIHDAWGVVVGWLKRDPMASDYDPPIRQMLWCRREDAEFVVGRGERYVVAPAQDVTVVGRVPLDPISQAVLLSRSRASVGRPVAETVERLRFERAGQTG